MNTASPDSCFIPFTQPTSGIPLPEQFTFPFYYEPHTLSRMAAAEVQAYLTTQSDWKHNFGLIPDQEGLVIGKMFGVLVVKNKEGALGFLAAFSGKLAGVNHLKGFVPPIFNMLTEGGFFRKEEEVLNAINRKIESLEQSEPFRLASEQVEAMERKAQSELEELKAEMRQAKKERKKARGEAEKELEPEHLPSFLDELVKESLNYKFLLKDLSAHWERRLNEIRAGRDHFIDEIEALKEERKSRSAALQQQLFEQYQFLNAEGEMKSLIPIFLPTLTGKPPAGAGECAAPKLLQYAYVHQLQPIAMAEFWWGASPKSEIRKHGQYYPACRGKCEPILGHMLIGLDVEKNPMLVNPAEGKELPIVYEDEHLLIVNKPAEFLSVPGKNIEESVYTRMKERYPKATGPLVVHRLDMSTSGLMVIAKDKEIHKHLQHQFIHRKVKKQYVALLEGEVQGDRGRIDLPLRVDLDNRPSQLVCYEHGKPAQTDWEVIEKREGKTLIRFFPITGRTHQLRVHAAHSSGLNTPIVGDDLYGNRDARLHLHAAVLEFTHPVSRTWVKFEVKAEYE